MRMLVLWGAYWAFAAAVVLLLLAHLSGWELEVVEGADETVERKRRGCRRIARR